VVYIDFGADWYVPFNVLSGEGDPHQRASLCLDAILRVFPELQTAPLFTELFLSGLVVLIRNRLPITYLQRLLSDSDFRRECLKRVEGDELVQLTFRNFEALGRDQIEAAGSTLRRAFQLSFNATTRLSLGQPDNKLPLRRFMDEGRFMIFNLGGIRDDLSRRIIGAMLMVQLEQAALSRTDQLPSERTPHSILVDEWPVFAATEDSLGHILSQARKFGLNIYLACQSLSQISNKRLSGAFENCKLGVFFALGHDSAELSSRQIGEIDPFTIKEAAGAEDGDTRSPITHDQYLPLMEQIQIWTNELKQLDPRYCYVKADTGRPIKIRTCSVPEAKVEKEEVEQVLATYRQLYQRSKDQAEEAMQSLTLPEVPARDDVPSSILGSAFDWEAEG
jgi:type IV secretory pathway TraG/TraD family ATPase VirD4